MSRMIAERDAAIEWMRARIVVFEEGSKVIITQSDRFFRGAREWADRARSLRQAIIDLLVANDSDTLPDSSVRWEFDRVSRELELPESNADGIPFELQAPPPEPGYAPELFGGPGEYVVRWGAGDDCRRTHRDLSTASEHYRRCIIESLKSSRLELQGWDGFEQDAPTILENDQGEKP